MSLAFARISGEAVTGVLDDVARLRIAVFREFPYLYDGSMEYERTYLAKFAAALGAVIVTAHHNGRLVGAATGCALAGEHDAFKAPFLAKGIPPKEVFYCAESVLLEDYRGQGAGHRFFDLREEQARQLGARHVAFCAVQRPADHPLRPAGYRPLDGFWRKRGYVPADGMTAHFSWRDLGSDHDTEKPMQFWMRTL